MWAGAWSARLTATASAGRPVPMERFPSIGDPPLDAAADTPGKTSGFGGVRTGAVGTASPQG